MNLQHLTFEIKNHVAYIGLGAYEKKSMVVLNEGTLQELLDIIQKLQNPSQIPGCENLLGLIFFSHKENSFLAGVDVNLIGSLNTQSEATLGAEKGQELYNMIEDLPFPTIACINGVCLGGGLELALSCRHILCSDSPKTVMGLPEVKLGLLPGFGGTYRLPLRISLPDALDMILTGKQVPAKKALKLGLVDDVLAKERLLEMAPLYLQKPKFFQRKHSLKGSLEHLAQDNFITRKIIFQKARESVLKETKGHYLAPLKILDVMENGHGKSRTTYLPLEAQGFGELCVSDQSKNLRHLFFLMEESKKSPQSSDSKDTISLKRGAVLGAGTMGGGIAWLMADFGLAPIMKDIQVSALELGLKQSSKNFQRSVSRKKMSVDEFERKQRSISPQLDFTGFKKVDLLIEAIVEDMGIKQKVLKEVEQETSDDCLITSNTSSLSITEMASVLRKPERFAGLHFFNPVHRMPLVEIVSHDKASPETLNALYQWVLKTKKTPIIVKDGPGFLVNRILLPYMNEAIYLLEEGYTLDEVDHAGTNFGMPMGPCRLMDEVGLDVAVKVAHIMENALGPRAKASTLSAKIAETKAYGKKSQKGFYLYDDK